MSARARASSSRFGSVFSLPATPPKEPPPTALVEFIIDTGSDLSILAPADSKKLRIDRIAETIATVPKAAIFTGVSMSGKEIQLDGLVKIEIVFTGVPGLGAAELPISTRIAIPRAWDGPSVLGRDVLQNFRVVLDYFSEPATVVLNSWTTR